MIVKKKNQIINTVNHKTNGLFGEGKHPQTCSMYQNGWEFFLLDYETQLSLQMKTFIKGKQEFQPLLRGQEEDFMNHRKAVTLQYRSTDI